MSSHLPKRALILLATLIVSQQSVAQENGIISNTANSSNPFEFKPKAAPAPESVQQVIIQNENLSAQQRETVANMIKAAVDATQMKVPEANEALIDGEKYILLKSGDRYLGVSSGMFVVFSSMKNDYTYYDTKKYKRIMTEGEYLDIAKESKSMLEKAIGAVQKSGVTEQIKESVNILSNEGIRPLPLSNKDD
jgi:hypothetical protein|tara:strand:+ start:3168 stop:3746 length:579 start_codon:yes stop_codon:yes gene_type:complete